MSRSKLCAKALSEYLVRHRFDDVTEKIDAALAKIHPISGRVGESGVPAIRALEW